MTKEERQANLAKRKTERALESLMASTAAAASANNRDQLYKDRSSGKLILSKRKYLLEVPFS